MRSHSPGIPFIISMVLLAVLACQPGPAPAPTFIVTVKPVTPATSALPFQTATPVISSPTLAQVVFESTAHPTFTLEGTGLPTFPPTDTLIPSPTIPLVSVSAATNCRTGPGREYDRVFVVDIGITYEITGRFTPDDYWIIRLPNGGQCWLWGQYASTAGNVSSLPEMVPPPTPTPAVGAVTGTITDAFDGSKVSNVVVKAQLSNVAITTNSDGTYFIGNLPKGQEFITVADGSHKPEYRSVNIDSGNTVTADFVLTYVFLGNLKFTVEGLVLLNSQPAAGVSVSVWSRNASAVTDSNGRYRIEFQGIVGVGSYLILAELGDFRGIVEVDVFNGSTAPDIILLPR